MIVLFSFLFLVLCGLTFLPSLRLLYAKNPPFFGMVLTLASSFLGVYGALLVSHTEDSRDRMARAATLIEMTKESLSATRVEARLLRHLRDSEEGQEGAGMKLASAHPRGLDELLKNGAVLEQISPESLKALLGSQANMDRDLRLMAAARGRDRSLRVHDYLRELAFAQGVLSAEAEFQRGNIGRGDLADILHYWELKKSAPAI